MKVLITGGKGMLGSKLATFLQSKGYEVSNPGSNELDITNTEQVRQYLLSNSPDFIINCAAYTNVEQAESEEEKPKVFEINTKAPGKLAKLTDEANIGFMHISTDYVFSANDPRGYAEFDVPTQPAYNYYGETKRLGEFEVMKNNPNSYIVRVQWTFGEGGKNLVDTMLKLAETRTELNVVEDEVGVPTYTYYVAQSIAYILDNSQSIQPGFYHAVSEGQCSRYEQVQYIYEIAKLDVKLNPIRLADYPRKAKVPNFSILKNTRLPKLPDWREGIREYILSKQHL
ncbi:MAG: NAD(P)-dependent oxidoreductase [Candidatus Dojkabacteria bacterium]|nr:MAG: NAD(P)-dependent oxidoreductase [Candidatus Dojkabacteria bacterium]